MESPISYIGAEIFLQHCDNLVPEHMFQSNKIIYYTKYVFVIKPIRCTNFTNFVLS
jgi:hypothetical protein